MQRPGCEEHPQSPAVARCAVCGKYLCRECVVEVSSRAVCAECAGTRTGRSDTAREKTEAYKDAADDPGSREPASRAAPEETEATPRASSAPRQAPARAAAACLFHPGVRAVARCSACGALICQGCLRVAGDRRVCEACHRAAPPRGEGAAQAGRRTGRVDTAPARWAAPWKLWPGLAFIPLPFALNGLMTYMMRQGDEISVGAAQVMLSLLLYSSLLAFAFIAVSRYGDAFREVGLHAGNLPASIGLGLIGGSLAFWLAVASGLISQAMLGGLSDIERWLQGFFDVNVKDVTGLDVLIAGIIIVIAAPVCEEVFFRGYLYPAMRGRFGLWGSALLNGVLFSAVHFSVFGLAGRTMAGVIFCFLYEYNENLWSPIAAHAVNNFVAFFLPLVAIWSTRLG